jgi:hypothetical protein
MGCTVAARRQQGGDECDHGHSEDSDDEGEGVSGRQSIAQRGGGISGDEGQVGSNSEADAEQEDGFAQNHSEDIAAAGAKGHAHTDLVAPLHNHVGMTP